MPRISRKRLDVFLSERYPETSRARVQQWIRDGRVLVDQIEARASLRLRGDETIDVDPAPATPLKAFAEDIPLELLYEDDDIVAVNKAAGMIVHSGAGAKSGTLVNALLHHFSNLSTVGGELRPGIVHRLDRMTSGVLLVAKNDRAHQAWRHSSRSGRFRRPTGRSFTERWQSSIPPRGRSKSTGNGGSGLRCQSAATLTSETK